MFKLTAESRADVTVQVATVRITLEGGSVEITGVSEFALRNAAAVLLDTADAMELRRRRGGR